MLLKSFARSLATAATVNSPKLQDIVVIGGGPAGLSLLAALKNSHKTKHLKCTLVEGSSLELVRDFGINPPDEYTNRVVSLTPKSIEFMQEKIGNWDYIDQDRIKFFDNIVAYDSQDKDSRIRFDASTVGVGVLAAMCENLNIQSSLISKIDDLNSNIKDPSIEQEAIILDNTKVVEIINPKEINTQELLENDPEAGVPEIDWPIVKLSNGDVLQTRLLVGADGFNSPVRKFSHIPSRGWSYNRFGLVATIKHQFEDYRSMAWQRFLTTGPLAILPLTEDNATIVWSTTPELSELFMKVDEEIFPHLINAAMTLSEVDLNYIYEQLKKDPNDKSVLEDIDWRMSKIKLSILEEKYPLQVTTVLENSRARFPLKLSHADTYAIPRIALIGDAAHTVHPLAGQGLNMGQSDVAHLIKALEDGVSRGLDIGSTLVLENYTANAWPANHVLMGVCDKLHKIFSTDWFPIVFLRGFGMKSLNIIDTAKDLMIKAISGR
ncbi:uncharacterized protein AC631_00022 [Debaryomyces fabryi]|uniref:Ubiquinone biosynthesis monooxygenase COQ6, mitochondrial n=1 Tax=Debaryomyces fabryi TaxID=58627 RepID=A0A0V1Q6R5_9ASCO|nr:uncharacterized protein AC631_00022 [Debaryomyces fabryi]KSA04151.1 hypothetical protein AC631_00022 [Debaryomyces fabryi]CUM46207.1 unnamed protein product [Debaryomyces fabryi]